MIIALSKSIIMMINDPDNVPAMDGLEDAMALPARYRELQERARQVASSCEPFAVEADRLSTFHPETLAVLAESGLPGLTVPARFGGEDEEVDPLAICVVREVLMGTSAQLDQLFAMQGIGSYAISSDGSPEQQEEWLPRVASLTAIAALALTEPETGSDLRNVSTTIEADGDELVLSGRKAFISNANAAAFFSVLAREDDGHSLVLVPASSAGVRVEELGELIAPHVIGDVSFEAVRVPATARIGPPRKAFSTVLKTLAVFRASVAGASLGLARAALEEAVRHTTSREQFGRPLARIGAVEQMLAESWTELEMARLLTYRAAMLARDNDPRRTLARSSMAKLAATEMACRVADRSVQVMGRFGLLRDSKVERLYRAARPMRIYEGASEVLRGSIAKALCEEWADGSRP
jgi:acyl-CoA dehydrogenase